MPNAASQTEGFMLGAPALVCRWRLAGGRLPLENRHLRALGARTLGTERVSTGLVAWAKQQVEWSLASGAAEHPDGVLMLIVDGEGQAAMTVGPYEPLAKTTFAALVDRARDAAAEGRATGIAPETLWGFRGPLLVCGAPSVGPRSGAATLVGDLACTLGMRVEHCASLVDDPSQLARLDEAFLVSDEHGVVVASDCAQERSARFAQGYERLLAHERAR